METLVEKCGIKIPKFNSPMDFLINCAAPEDRIWGCSKYLGKTQRTAERRFNDYDARIISISLPTTLLINKDE